MSWKDQIRPQAAIVQRALLTPVGIDLMELLESVFQKGELMGKTPEETAYNVGQFEAVEYLKELRDLEVSNDG